jgi:hypothetical protein
MAVSLCDADVLQDYRGHEQQESNDYYPLGKPTQRYMDRRNENCPRCPHLCGQHHPLRASFWEIYV